MKQLRGAIAFALLLAAATPAAADARFEGRYAISIAGLTVGTAAIVLDVRPDGYVAAGSAKLTGVMRAIASGQGTAAVRGSIVGGRLVPQSYSMTAESQKKTDEVRMAMANGMVRDFSAVPPLLPEPTGCRSPGAPQKVLDPLSALFHRPVATCTGPEACNRTLPISMGAIAMWIRLCPHRKVSGAKAMPDGSPAPGVPPDRRSPDVEAPARYGTERQIQSGSRRSSARALLPYLYGRNGGGNLCRQPHSTRKKRSARPRLAPDRSNVPSGAKTIP
jgi:hypothetical protein